jgi:hypothetical protein
MKKVQTIKFQDFMDGSYKQQRKVSPKVYSISPFALMDPTIMIVGGVIVGIAILERVFESQGNYDVAEGLHMAFNIAIPMAAFGFIWHLINVAAGAFL